MGLCAEAFLVSEDFQGDVLLVFVVKTFEYLAEASLSEPVDNLKSIANVLAFLGNVLVLVVIESVVVHAIWCRWRPFGGLPIINIEPVNSIVVEDFLLFNFHQVF